MGRLELSDIRRLTSIEAEDQEPASMPLAPIASEAPCSFLVGKKGVDMRQLLPELQQDKVLFLASEGEWSLHEIIRYLFTLTGPASLSLTSWGLSEKPLKQLLDLVEEGLATDPIFLLDFRVKLQSAAAYQMLLASGLDIRLTHNHSKLVVILNDEWGVTVVTSSNLTNNNRIETYVISTHRQWAMDIRAWLKEMHAKANPLT